MTGTALGGRSEAARGQRLSGDPGVWIFIAADTAAFGLFFLVFTIGRMSNPAAYSRSAKVLSVELGALNTVILLTSGWLMALAVEAARHADRVRVVRCILLALLVGSGFAITKLFEYAMKIQAGITMLTNEFFMYYFAFTGLHFLHFLIGIGVLIVLLSKARSGAIDARFLTWIESGACYWHMVDLLWIVLFPLLYLQR